MNMNLCVFEGRLTRDPELRYTPTGTPVMDFSIAINHSPNSVSFINLEAWEQTAEMIAEKFKKGDLIRVYTRYFRETWQDKTTGEKRSKDKFKLDAFLSLGINKGLEENPTPTQEQTPTRQTRQTVPADDEDIPF